MKDKFSIVHLDDWAALYKNGKEVTQDHNIQLERLAKEAGIELTVYWIEEGAEEVLEIGEGDLPANLDEIPTNILGEGRKV